MPETDTEIAHDLRNFALGNPIIGDAPREPGWPVAWDSAGESATSDGAGAVTAFKSGASCRGVNAADGFSASPARLPEIVPSPMASITRSDDPWWHVAALAVAVAVLVWRWAL
jgi:hypothetical protein